MSLDYYLKGEVIKCPRCIYVENDGTCGHPIVRAPGKTIGCDHGETYEMKRERERHEAKRANHRD